MTLRPAILLLLIVAVAASAAAQTPAAGAAPAGAGIAAEIASLGSLDYPVRTRAARLLRRDPQDRVVPALVAAVRNAQADEYVRYRAFILLTSLDERATGALARDMLHDRDDRVRETAYKWLEQHPDPQLTSALVAALQTEQAEFVRPALVNALAALGRDPQVQRALVMEVDRGLVLFRSAVIDALGRHRADYAVDALAAVAREEGPLQTDAILALGRIGGEKARAALGSVPSPAGETAVSLQTARCLAGDACVDAIEALTKAASQASARPSEAQAAISGLADLAAAGHDEAMTTLLHLAGAGGVRDAVAVAVATAAVRQPDRMLAWLGAAAESDRAQAIDLLKDGFESLEEDYGEEQFFAAIRAAYWKAPDNSPARALTAAIIERLEF